MSSITIRDLDPGIKERLRVQAAEHGHSMEAEVRQILRTALKGVFPSARPGFFERIHARFAALGGVDFEPAPREPSRAPPRFV